MSNSFLAQILMMVLAVGMLVFYVSPTFDKIGKVQDSIIEYNTERTRVNEVNAQLASLISDVNQISSADMTALLTYMPDQIDHVAVSRDIYNMAEGTGVSLNAVKYSGTQVEALVDGELPKPKRHDFAVAFTVTYDQLKTFLKVLEQNNYPLEVIDFKASTDEFGLISTEMVIATYSHQ